MNVITILETVFKEEKPILAPRNTAKKKDINWSSLYIKMGATKKTNGNQTPNRTRLKTSFEN